MAFRDGPGAKIDGTTGESLMSAQVGTRAGPKSRKVGTRLPGAAEPDAYADDPMQRVRLMFGIRESPDLASRLRCWLAAKVRVHGSPSGGLDQAWIRDELDHLSSTYEAALGASRRRARTSTRSR